MSKTRLVLRERNTPFTWFILFFAAIFFLPSMLMPHIWLDVRSVEVVTSGVIGQPIEMQVDREIVREFHGTFLVQVRKPDGALVCEGRPINSFIYNPENELPVPLLLSWWLGGVDILEECKAAGMKQGNYYIDSCHTVLATVWDIPLARRCVRSNIFSVIHESVLQ